MHRNHFAAGKSPFAPVKMNGIHAMPKHWMNHYSRECHPCDLNTQGTAGIFKYQRVLRTCRPHNEAANNQQNYDRGRQGESRATSDGTPNYETRPNCESNED